MEPVTEKIIAYLNTAREPLPPITDPDQLLHIDSLGLIRLVAFMENDLGIRVEDEEMLADNFVTLRALCDFLEQKQRRQSEALA